MINPFVLKRVVATTIMVPISVLVWVLLVNSKGFFWAVGSMLVCTLISFVLGKFLLRTPLRDLEEGRGILWINFDSTGIIQPFIMSLENPFMTGFFRSQRIKDIFNRKSAFNLKPPIITEKPIQLGSAERKGDWVRSEKGVGTYKDDGGLTVRITKEELNDSRYRFNNFPAFIWNDNLKSLMTKSVLSEMENKFQSEHGIMHLLHLVREHARDVRDFARYVAEQLRPEKESWFTGRWVWIILAVLVAILIFMFAPTIIQSLQASGVGSAIGSATSSTPTVVVN